MELSKHLMLDKKVVFTSTGFMSGRSYFPKSLQDLRSPSIFASDILIVIQIPELNMTKDCEGAI